MPTIDMDRIKARLAERPHIAERIARDYDLSEVPSDPDTFADAIISRFGQMPLPSEQTLDSIAVYRAAVRALGSNSRTWAMFLRNEPALREVLADYDPSAVAQHPPARNELKQLLPGQTATGDARAILAWASMLAEAPGYYTHLLALREACGQHFEEAEVLPVVASILGRGLRRPRVCLPSPPPGLTSWKTPGMGPVLCSEFLRNLGWTGFKPDRHIKRLLGQWFPDVIEASRPRARELARLLGSGARELADFLTFSLVGTTVAPPDCLFTEVDNLVWLLGAYVEKKGKESDCSYRQD